MRGEPLKVAADVAHKLEVRHTLTMQYLQIIYDNNYARSKEEEEEEEEEKTMREQWPPNVNRDGREEEEEGEDDDDDDDDKKEKKAKNKEKGSEQSIARKRETMKHALNACILNPAYPGSLR